MNRCILVLQTIALPLGYCAIQYPILNTLYVARYKKICFLKANDSNGNRTRVTAVKGRCLNRLTMEPL